MLTSMPEPVLRNTLTMHGIEVELDSRFIVRRNVPVGISDVNKMEIQTTGICGMK